MCVYIYTYIYITRIMRRVVPAAREGCSAGKHSQFWPPPRANERDATHITYVCVCMYVCMYML